MVHRPGEAVDLHSHYWPREMHAALVAGRPWHGWEPLATHDAGIDIGLGERTTLFRHHLFERDFAARLERRAAREGVVREAVMVPVFLWGYELAPADAIAFCRDVNADVADLQASHLGRITGLGILPLQDPAATAQVLDHGVRELGLSAFAIGTNVEGRGLDDPGVVAALDQVLAAGAALVLHANWWTRAGAERMQRHYFGNSVGVPLEAGLALADLIYSGLLDRHPAARIACCHGGGWLPAGIGRLNLRYQQGRDGGDLEMAPDRYLSRITYDCLVHDELALRLLVERVGADRVVIGTDHPYEGDIPVVGATRWIAEQASLSSRDKDLIVRENAASFLDGAAAAVAGADR